VILAMRSTEKFQLNPEIQIHSFGTNNASFSIEAKTSSEGAARGLCFVPISGKRGVGLFAFGGCQHGFYRVPHDGLNFVLVRAFG
jgi:hypothetical protein